jgi:hypothetical protein
MDHNLIQEVLFGFEAEWVGGDLSISVWHNWLILSVATVGLSHGPGEISPELVLGGHKLNLVHVTSFFVDHFSLVLHSSDFSLNILARVGDVANKLLDLHGKIVRQIHLSRGHFLALVGNDIVESSDDWLSGGVEFIEDGITVSLDLALESFEDEGSVWFELEWLVLDKMLGNFLNPLFEEFSLLVEGAIVSACHFVFDLIGKSLCGFISLITEILLRSVLDPHLFLSNGISELCSALVEYFIHDFSASLHFTFLFTGEIINTL